MNDTPVHRKDVLDKIETDYLARDGDYRIKKKQLGNRWTALNAGVDASKQPVSEQILLEASWLIKYSDDWARAGATLDRLAAQGNGPQSPLVQGDDGSWGPGYQEWYRKLEPTVDALQRDKLTQQPLRALTFMKRLEDPAFVIGYLDSLRVSRIRATGRNNRDEFGAVLTALSQLIFKSNVRKVLNDNPKLDFNISPELEAAYIAYLWKIQNPGTGYWGPSYDFSGTILEVQDLSFTFHIVHYYDDGARNVPNLPRIARTTLDIHEDVYPNGWRPTDQPPLFVDHNNYDTVTVLSSAWEDMDNALRDVARPKLQEVLDWCLTTSLKGNEFNRPADVAPVDAYYFGVKFLNVIGFWKPNEAFWPVGPLQTPPGTPSAPVLAQRLLDKFKEVDDGSEAAETTKNVLRAALDGKSISPLT